MTLKPDADASLALMEAWWDGTNEVPCLSVWYRPGPLNVPNAPADGDWARAWHDFDRRLADAVPLLETTFYGAENFPTFEPNLGPDILSTIFGLQLEFLPDTSWGVPIAETVDQLDLTPRFDAPEWQAVEDFTRRSVTLSDGRWTTLITDLHPNLDVLSALIGPANLCMELLDHPDAVSRALRIIDAATAEALRRLNAIIQTRPQPYTSWMRALSSRPSHIVQCDFSAMISTDQFREFALPSLRAEMAMAERRVYHLDGPDALRHLDDLLAEPGLEAIQWVYGAGHGPARQWVEVYQRILAAGKSIRVDCQSAEDVFALAPVLGSRGVWYNTGADSRAELDALFDAVGRPRPAADA